MNAAFSLCFLKNSYLFEINFTTLDSYYMGKLVQFQFLAKFIHNWQKRDKHGVFWKCQAKRLEGGRRRAILF